MKSFYTLLLVLCTMAVNAQSQPIPLSTPAYQFEPSKTYPVNQHRAQHINNSRANTVSFYMDYGLLDSFYNEKGPNAGSGFWYRNDQYSFRQINTGFAVDSTDFQKWAIVWYPRVIDMVNNHTWPFTEYDVDKIRMTIDTVYMTVGHLHLSGPSKYDTIRLSVWDLDAFQTLAIGSGGDSGATGTLLGRSSVIINSSILGGDGQGSSPGTFLLGTYPFAMPTPVVVPQGHRFLIQVDYFGPSEDAFLLSSSRRNDCASQCGASIPYVNATFNSSIANFNSLFGIRYVSPGATGIYPSTLFYNDCNFNQQKDTVCEELYTQDLAIMPHLVTDTAPVITGVPVMTQDRVATVNTFPNPANDNLFITVNGFAPRWVTIYDINSKKLSEQKFDKQIDIHTLPQGTYIIEVKDEDIAIRSRIIKM